MSISSDPKFINKIDELLNEHRTAKGVADFTHVSMGGITFAGKFNFDSSKKNDKIIKYISAAAERNLFFSIAEKLQVYAPIMVDVDLKVPKENYTSGRLYNDAMLMKIIEENRNAIKKYLKVSNNELTCWIFEKNSGSEKNGEMKDGIHLIFPYIVASDKVRHLVFKYVYDTLNEEDLFANFSNASEVLDDKIVSTNPWLMYGCCKPGGTPYVLTRVFDHNNISIDIKTCGSRREITTLLSLRDSRWSESNATPLNESINIDDINTSYSDLTLATNNDTTDDMTPTDKLEMVNKAIKLTEMLNPKRANNFHEWIRVGWALHNTHAKSLLDTWDEFSKTSQKYVKGGCERLWNNMKDDGYTIRSLMLWAKEDNPEEYKKFIKEEFENHLKKNAINNTFMIAKALYSKYFDKFVCANPKDNMWYHFSDHRWRKCINGGRLIVLISEEFANYYIAMAQEYSQKAMDGSPSDKKTFLQESASFTKIAENLMDINFKERIMKEAKHIFYDDMFLKRLDENPNLIGFENGVYDLVQKKFRSGQADDHISMSTRVHYSKWSDKNPYAPQIFDFFQKILPNKNVRDYFLSRLSTCVSGENKEEKFYFCTGSGSNGKSLCFQLVSEALGDYYISCPITIITRKRGASNAASPEMARMKGPRCGVYQEPGTDETINVGIFKEISGNDKFMVRGLFQDPFEVKSQMKSWMTTNELPEINSDDGGTWRRLRVIDFGSKFVENPDPTNPNEFLLDDSLKSKISQWAGAFASYLIHIYNTQYDVPNKTPEPEEVQVATNLYRKDQDFVREYFDSFIETTVNKNDTIKKKDLHDHFKMWFEDIHKGDTMPKCKKLNEFMDKSLKQKYTPRGWTCIRFKQEEKEEKTSDLDL